MNVEQFVAEHGTWMLRLAYLLTGSQYAAEDLCQDALVKVITSQRRVFNARHPKAYVRRIIINCHLDQTRIQKLEAVPLNSATVVVDDHSERLTQQAHNWRHIAKLSRPIRTALVLRYYEDLDDAEIASIQGCSRSTVRSNVSRGLAQLRESFTDQATEDEAHR
ncbi:MAG: SigE family RNA polymerase sigma factor [Actinomycetia bacterium]|nr:SigE family RNA polymerase sigma factor [Actinomycetes bacterium]